MEFCDRYGFDPEYTVLLKGAKAEIKLQEVQRAFALLDLVVKIQQIDSLPDTISCQFMECITPMLLDGEHSADGECWEVIQIDEYCPQGPDSFHLAHDVVPLARAIDDVTASFREQVNELALAYNVSPMTLNQAAVSHMCGKNDTYKGLATSTPALGVKTQSTPGPRSTAACDDGHVPKAKQALDADSLLVDPVPAEVQRVIVEHIVKHSSPMHTPSALELLSFSGNSPKLPNEVGRLRAKQVLNDSTLSEGQQRRVFLDSLASPALNVALSIGSQAPPKDYLDELDKAYGNVTGGEELYIQYLETHQNSGEKASDYLRRLQTLLQEVVDGNGRPSGTLPQRWMLVPESNWRKRKKKKRVEEVCSPPCTCL